MKIITDEEEEKGKDKKVEEKKAEEKPEHKSLKKIEELKVTKENS